MNSQHQKRLRAEKRFQWYGRLALGVAVALLLVLIGSIAWRGYQGFEQTQIRLPIAYDPAVLEISSANDIDSLRASACQRLAQHALESLFPQVTEHGDKHALYALVTSDAGIALKHQLEHDPALFGQTAEAWLPASSDADLYFKGRISAATPAAERRLSDPQLAWLDGMNAQGRVRSVFNASFFTHGDSRSPEQAGLLSSMAGSALTMIICLLAAFPLGVATAVYLEEFARKSRWVDLVEVNINNLAAVPSIVFGLLGLAAYINTMGLPRSSAVVAGLTLAMMILPVIIIATRASLASVPGSIRDAARALGATPLQVVWHHTLPLAMPGIMTGTILGLARAIGETAPLIMIGMVAFVSDTPAGFTSPTTVMPVQIYLWASSPEMGFAEKTAAGILVLLALLLAMNALAIFLRKRFEVRW